MACPVTLPLPGAADALVAAAMVASLAVGTAAALARLLLDLPAALVAAARSALAAAAARGAPPPGADPPSAVRYYTGTVRHTRRKPAKHAFSYPVRTALVNLDAPPAWWAPSGAAADHLTADAARAAAGVGEEEEEGRAAPEGSPLRRRRRRRRPPPVWVLTSPPAAGYAQNPISVYYVWGDGDGRHGAPTPADADADSGPPSTSPTAALAVVTNTPWGARVCFAFDPRGDKVAKCLHVSPFMDMEATWLLSATPPGRRLHVAVGVDHPTLGRFFDATLDATCDGWQEGEEGEEGGRKQKPPPPRPAARSERGSLSTLLAYGYMPHRTAAWIYWHAVVLWLAKGSAIFSPPARGEDERRTKQKERQGQGQGGGDGGGGGAPSRPLADTRPVREGGRGHAWTPARVWPWSVQQ